MTKDKASLGVRLLARPGIGHQNLTYDISFQTLSSDGYLKVMKVSP